MAHQHWRHMRIQVRLQHAGTCAGVSVRGWLCVFVFAIIYADSCHPSSHAWQVLPIKSYEEYLAGLPGGEGEEHPKCIARCPAAPDVVYLSIDIAGTWRSTNAGRSWIKNRDEGLYVQQLQSCAVDPLDANRVFVLAAYPSGQEANYGPFTGIYRSDDGGTSWTNVFSILVPYKGAYQRLHRNLIACRPPRPGQHRATVWYACVDERGIFVSTNSGDTWITCISLTTKVFYTLAVVYNEATDQDILYVGSSEGLIRYEQHAGLITQQNLQVPQTYAPADGYEGGVSAIGLVYSNPGYSHSRSTHADAVIPVPLALTPATSLAHAPTLPRSALPPTPALPTNVVWPRQTAVPTAALPFPGTRVSGIFAVRLYDKAYFCDDPAPTSATQWVELPLVSSTGTLLQIIGTSSNDWPGVGYARLLFLNPYSNEFAYLVCGSQFFYLANNNGTQSWIQVDPLTGFTNNPTIATYFKTLRANHTGMAFDPRNPNDIVAYSLATIFRSESAGRSWMQSNAGFTGYAWTFGRNTLQFHRQDSNTVMLLCNDVGPIISTTRWAWFWSCTNGSTPSGLWKGTIAGDFDPDNTFRMFSLMGLYTTGFRPVRSRDFGLSWQYPGGTNFAVPFQRARCVRYTDTSSVYAAWFYSTNDGNSLAMVNFYAQYPGRVSVPNPGVDPPYTLLDASTNHVHPILYAGNCNSYRIILRGEYLGGMYRWSRVYDNLDYSFRQYDYSPTFAADPHVPTRIYGAAALGQYLVRYDTNLGLTNLPPLSLIEITNFRPYLPRQTATLWYNHIADLDPDPTESNVVFVGTGAPGLPFVFKVRYTGFATITVEDITGNLPRLGMRAMRVDPWSGDLYIGTHAGTFVLRNP